MVLALEYEKDARYRRVGMGSLSRGRAAMFASVVETDIVLV